jgi:hypothetical protein
MVIAAGDSTAVTAASELSKAGTVKTAKLGMTAKIIGGVAGAVAIAALTAFLLLPKIEPHTEAITPTAATEAVTNQTPERASASELAPIPELSPEPTPEPTPEPVLFYGEVGDVINFGGYDWRILDLQEGKALLLSEYIIATAPYYSYDDNMTWEERSSITLDWETSLLRHRLNEIFYEEFSESEQSQIVETRVVNDDNPWFGTTGGNDTDDKIFLLSIDEVVKYFGDSGQLGSRLEEERLKEEQREEERRKRASQGGSNAWGMDTSKWVIDDDYNAARTAYTVDGVSWLWWLRSPGGSGNSAATIGNSDFLATDEVVKDEVIGQINISGFHYSSDGFGRGGVRPAMWIGIE